MENDSKISMTIILPMYNEGEHISENMKSVLNILKKTSYNWELLVIDDGSTDDSRRKAEETLSGIKNARVISYQTNRGRGFALRIGFANAKGDYIITTESDLNWGTDIIFKIKERLDVGDLDIVIASPYLKDGRLENVPLKRAFLSRLGNKILSLSFSGNLSMLTGMTRGYRRAVIESLDLDSEGKEIHLEIISKANALGYKIGEIPAILRWKKSKKGEKKRKSSFNAKEIIFSHLLFSFGESPIILLGTVSAIFITAGVIIGLYLINLSLFQGIPVRGRPIMLLMVLLILIGIQILVFCFVANQNRDMYKYMVKLESKINKIVRQSKC
ncbi:MAG: glycosyltransferase family 2 protein [Elusimicrobia bacterium]|nr:glycosyltransferase family 2 protein [Elusimicrobiota bacterium]